MYKRYLLLILIFVSLSGIFIIKPKEEVKLDNVILKQEVNNKTFAMYKEEGNDYVPVNDNKFPDMYVLNIEKSKCIDNNGNELNGVLSYENDKVTITSGNTTYCYLYFDKSLGLEIKEKESKGLKTDKVRGAMYRFQGQQSDGVNNYICFGTSDKDKCTTDTDHYMYRIIGIEAETGRLKVIKKEALNETVQWYIDTITEIKFPDSKIYASINGNKFLTNKDYVSTSWEEKISNNTWMYGDMIGNSTVGAKQIGEELYQTETGKKATQWYNYATEETPGAKQTTDGNIIYYTEENRAWTDKFTSKISLMNLSDYSYSVSDEAQCNYYHGNTEYVKCKSGWMHLSQNDASAPSESEWTMIRNGWNINFGTVNGYDVNSIGYTYVSGLDGALSVRPVFYINASEKLLSKDATGTITDPFMIKE